MKKKRLMAGLTIMAMLLMTVSSTVVYGAMPENDTAKVTIVNDANTTAVSISGSSFQFYKVFNLIVEDATAEQEESISYEVNDEFIGFFDGVLDRTLADYLADTETYTDEEAARSAYNHAAADYIKKCKVMVDGVVSGENTMGELVRNLRDYINTEGIAAEATTGTTVTTTDGVEEIESDEMPYGYYLMLDSKQMDEEAGFVPAGSLLTVPGRAADQTLSADVTTYMKGSLPNMNKEVWHNDITNKAGDHSIKYKNAGSWDEVSDYQIGDIVEYRITATIPQDLTGYTEDTYQYVISDTLSEGLELIEDSVKIYFNKSLTPESEAAGKYHETIFPHQDGEPTFRIEFNMYGIVQQPSLREMGEFYISYQAIVTEDAKIAKDYETNTAKLEFSNNPYDETSVGEIEDTVYTYTFDLDILKTEGDGVTPLPGAKFALYEVTGEADTYKETPIYLELDTNLDDAMTSPQKYYTVNDNVQEDAGVIITNESGKFVIAGLDDETTYMLKEIDAPNGFNAIDPITFKIHAEYEFEYGLPTSSISTTGTAFKPDEDGSGLAGTIINTSNQLLPETGGIGTTIFTIVGSILMLGAVTLFVVKRRNVTK